MIGWFELSNERFYLQSNRDPNSTKTLKAFEDSIQWARNSKFDDDDIEEAKLSVFSAVSHILPTLIRIAGLLARRNDSHISTVMEY